MPKHYGETMVKTSRSSGFAQLFVQNPSYRSQSHAFLVTRGKLIAGDAALSKAQGGSVDASAGGAIVTWPDIMLGFAFWVMSHCFCFVSLLEGLLGRLF